MYLAEGPVALTPRVVLIPGIMGSQLLVTTPLRRIVWGDSSMLSWAPQLSQWTQVMAQGNGIDQPGNVVPGSFTRVQLPVRSAADIAVILSLSPALQLLLRQSGLRNIDLDPYGDALRYFTSSLGAANVLAFPYDWRLSNAHTAALLKRAIERKWGDSLNDGSRPITIVAHSMGGIISRFYIEQLGGDRVIRNLVTVGTPHAGAPEGLRVPTNLPSLARFLLPLDPASLLILAAASVVSPLAGALPGLHLLVSRFLRELQSVVLHFSSIYQLLPGYPFVIPVSGGAPEPLATSFDILRRSACSDPRRFVQPLICARPISDLRRVNDQLKSRTGAIPASVRYFSIVAHTHPTTVRCRRQSARELGAIEGRCGDGTVPAESATLPRSTNVRNRYVDTPWKHSDLLRERRILETCLNVARGQYTASVTGINEIAPACLTAQSAAALIGERQRRVLDVATRRRVLDVATR
jgi:pimeloyl-ACP methyl ester carboxylesterase